MTELLDRTRIDLGEETQAVDTGSPATPAAKDGWRLLAALLAGAGAIHLAMAPSHLSESGLEGTGFLVAAWVQLGLAVLLLARPSRAALGAVMAASAALIGAWVWSRTAGFPFGAHSGHAEDVSFIDGATVALEAAAIVTAGWLLLRPAGEPRFRLAAVVAGVAALALATAAIASPSARDHAAASHGDHDAGDGAAVGATGTADGAMDDGHDDHAGDAAHDDHAVDGSGGAVLAGGGATSVDGEAVDDLGFSELQNGQMGSDHHDHGEGAEVATELDPVIAGQLAEQLALTAPLAAAYPTIAHAKAAGYTQAGPFSPGLGTHFSGPGGGLNTDGVMDPEDIANPTLIYDGIEDDSPLAGFMYMSYQDTEPEGFVGDLDRWHFHTAVCIVMTPDGIRTPFGADLTGVTNEMCAAEGGSMIDFTGYMVHVWTVPGYESELGTFSDLNPKITCPDGTYHRLPISEVGLGDTVCTNA